MGQLVYIPKKLKIGYQKRDDTYTGKLAFVVCFDERGKLRKERSWEGWRDKKIKADDYDNEPLSGFVLNKKVGGYKSSWNYRNAYVRVYDPRGFEFEITIPNLLFILENVSSIKGKGLEGEFVYGWQGTELMLIPVNCPDYVEMKELNSVRHNKTYLKADELKLGFTYLHKSGNELIYMGRYDKYNDEGKNKGKHHYFYNEKQSWEPITFLKSLGDAILKVVKEEIDPNYAKKFQKIETNTCYSPIDNSKTTYTAYTLDELAKLCHNRNRYNNKEVYINIRGKFEKFLVDKYSDRYVLWGERHSSRKSCHTIDEILLLKPHYIKLYLTNGKLYYNSK